MPAVLSAPSPNAKLGIAVIGCGGMGGGNPGIAARERLVALVDVDEKKLGEAVKKVEPQVSDPKTFFDYRKMYDECHKDIDVVLDIRRNFAGDWSIATQAAYEKVDANKIKFVLPLKPAKSWSWRPSGAPRFEFWRYHP